MSESAEVTSSPVPAGSSHLSLKAASRRQVLVAVRLRLRRFFERSST